MRAVRFSLVAVFLAFYAGCALSQTELPPTPAPETKPEETPAETVTAAPEEEKKGQSDCSGVFDLEKTYTSPRGDVEASGTDLTVGGEKYECVTYFVDNYIFNSATGYQCWSIVRQSRGSYLVTDRTVEGSIDPLVEDPKNITESKVCVEADAAIAPNKKWTMIKTDKFLPQSCHYTLKAHMFSYEMHEAVAPVKDQWLCLGSKLNACYRHQYLMFDNLNCRYVNMIRDGKTRCVANYVTKENDPVKYQVLVDGAFNFFCLAFSGGNYNNETRTSQAGIVDGTLVEGACQKDQTALEAPYGGFNVKLQQLDGYKCGGTNAVATSVVVLVISGVLASLMSV